MKYISIFIFFLSFSIIQAQLPFDLPYEWSEDTYIEPHRKEGIIDVSMLGMLPNTGEDLSATLQEILNNATDIDSIYLPSGNYYFKNSIMLPPNTFLYGDGKDTRLFFDIGEQRFCIGNQPVVSYTQNVNKQINIGDSIFNFDEVKYPVGTHFYLRSVDNDFTTSQWADKSLIQFNQIKSISLDSSSFTVLYPADRKRDSVTAQIVFPEFADNIEIKNIKIICLDKSERQTSNILFNNARNCRVSCVESESTNFAHVRIEWSQNIKVSGSYFHGAQAYGGGGQGYGVVLQFGSNDCLITDNIFDTLRHSVLLQAGAYGNVISANYSINPFWTDVFLPEDSAGDLVLHGNWVYNNLFQHNIAQNIVIDDSHGSNGPGNMFFRNRAENYGIFMNNNPASDNQIFIANEITSSAFLKGLYLLQGNGHIELGNILRGEYIGQEPNISIPDFITESIASIEKPYIGEYNNYNQATIPAKERYRKKIWTKCEFERTTSVKENIPYGKKSYRYISDYELRSLVYNNDYKIIDIKGRIIYDINNLNVGFYIIMIDKDIFIYKKHYI